MRQDGVALKKMPNSRVLALPGVTEASGLDVSIQGLSLYVADAKQGTVDVLKLSSSRSRQGYFMLDFRRKCSSFPSNTEP